MGHCSVPRKCKLRKHKIWPKLQKSLSVRSGHVGSKCTLIYFVGQGSHLWLCVETAAVTPPSWTSSSSSYSADCCCFKSSFSSSICLRMACWLTSRSFSENPVLRPSSCFDLDTTDDDVVAAVAANRLMSLS